jgi:hypothetical protein
MWALRERINETFARQGFVLKYDVSLPPSQFEKLMDEVIPDR